MMEQRAELSKKVLVTLTSAKRGSDNDLLTGDESWFWSIIDHEQQWTPAGPGGPQG
jgi:hypothetical protein